MQTKIREIDLNTIKSGGENPALVACEIPVSIPDNYPTLLKQGWSEAGYNIVAELVNKYGPSDLQRQVWDDLVYNPVECAKIAEKMGFSLLCVRFNSEDIEENKEYLKKILQATQLPLILAGTFRRDLDAQLLPELARIADRKCTIGVVEEENYKEIAPVINEYGHNIIARTPIDINLTKQLNILLTDLGISPDRILIDPNTGGLGYGLDYAYSIIERIKLAGMGGDLNLNMPIITFVGEEAWKTKEAKSDSVPQEWGDFKTRAISWECMTASAMFVSGSDIVVMRHPEAIKYINKFIKSQLF